MEIFMELYKALCEISGEGNVLKDEPMKMHTTFRIGGPADYFIQPSKIEVYTAMRTPMCLHGWSTLFTKPSRNRKSCGLFRVPHMPCPTRTIRRNIRSM